MSGRKYKFETEKIPCMFPKPLSWHSAHIMNFSAMQKNLNIRCLPNRLYCSLKMGTVFVIENYVHFHAQTVTYYGEKNGHCCLDQGFSNFYMPRTPKFKVAFVRDPLSKMCIHIFRYKERFKLLDK